MKITSSLVPAKDSLKVHLLGTSLKKWHICIRWASTKPFKFCFSWVFRDMKTLSLSSAFLCIGFICRQPSPLDGQMAICRPMIVTVVPVHVLREKHHPNSDSWRNPGPGSPWTNGITPTTSSPSMPQITQTEDGGEACHQKRRGCRVGPQSHRCLWGSVGYKCQSLRFGTRLLQPTGRSCCFSPPFLLLFSFSNTVTTQHMHMEQNSENTASSPKVSLLKWVGLLIRFGSNGLQRLIVFSGSLLAFVFRQNKTIFVTWLCFYVACKHTLVLSI